MARSRPNTSRPVPAAQSIERSNAVALRSLLACELSGAIQVGLDYPGRRIITDEHLAAHFAGDIAVAIRVGNGKGRSRHLVIDVDARAELRIPLVLAELRRLGYGDATIATDGSAADRGKIIVFFRSEQNNAALRALAGAVLDPLRCMPDWGIETPGDVAVYPQRGEGGLARIGGRNIGRNGPLERLWNAWGEPADLEAIAPSTMRLRPVRDRGTGVRTSRRQPWVEPLMREGVTWISVGGTRGLNALINRLAHEVARTHGTAEVGMAEFARVLDAIAAASPDLQRPSPKNADRRHPLGWGRRSGSAWNHVCELHNKVDTTFSGPAGHVVSTSHIVREAVFLLQTIVRRRGLNPLAFDVSYRELGSMLGISHEAARQRVLRAERVGLIVRIDPGLRGSGGKYTGRPGGGAKTLYAIVGAGESPDSVRSLAETHHAVKRRRAFVMSERDRVSMLRAERLAKKIVALPLAADDAGSQDLGAYARTALDVPATHEEVRSSGSGGRGTMAYIHRRIEQITSARSPSEDGAPRSP